MPESRTTKKSTTARKSSQTKKRTSARKPKAKKPKVALAKNKVVALCGIICGLCVISLALTVLLNGEEKQSPQTNTVAKAEESTQQNNLAPKTTEKSAQKTSETKVQSAKPQVQSEKKSPNAQIQSQKTMQTQPVKSQKTETAQNTAKNAQSQTAKTQNSPSQSAKTQNSSAIKTIPQSQTSQAGAMSNKNANTSAKSETKSTQAQNSQKTVQAPVISQNTAKPSANSQIASAKTQRESETIQNQVPRNRFDIPPASNGATIVIIIDDAGRSVENTKRYAALPFPITIAVLPKLPQSRACADAIRAAGKEVILHQPMQSLNYNLDPGPGKITTEMTTYEIARIVKENLSELGPGVRGLNNHEGSDVTSNEIKIGVVLDVCDEMGVYFLDSRTTAATKAPQAALERDMHIFEKAGPYLDNDIDRAKMLERMRETLAYANRHGRAIVIGHVDKSVKILPDLLAEMYPEMKAAGYRFATPSQLR